MSATQEKEKINPGDLVKMLPPWYEAAGVDSYGLGLYLGLKGRYHWVHWFKLNRCTRSQFLVKAY